MQGEMSIETKTRNLIEAKPTLESWIRFPQYICTRLAVKLYFDSFLHLILYKLALNDSALKMVSNKLFEF